MLSAKKNPVCNTMSLLPEYVRFDSHNFCSQAQPLCWMTTPRTHWLLKNASVASRSTFSTSVSVPRTHPFAQRPFYFVKKSILTSGSIPRQNLFLLSVILSATTRCTSASERCCFGFTSWGTTLDAPSSTAAARTKIYSHQGFWLKE